MDLEQAAAMVSSRGWIYEAALRDLEGTGETFNEYVRRIKDKAYNFVKGEGVWDRVEMIEELNDIVGDSGNFVCLLGGKSTRKSLLLRNLAKRNDTKVIVVNLRKHGGRLLGGLWSTLQTQVQEDKLQDILRVADSERIVKGLLGRVSGVAASAGDAEVQQLVTLMNAVHATLGEFTLVIDEANMAFNVKSTTTQAEIEQMKAALALFTTFSKEERQGNVILVSSEHAFPFGLTRPGIDFNLNNFSGFLYAGEVPPKDMLLLLKEEWGVGQHLALALLAHYGGHVWETSEALRRLRGSQARTVGLDPLKITDVQDCLAWRAQAAAEVEPGAMRRVLELLAIKGFAPIPTRDHEIAKVISQNNVGGVVRQDALVAGLPLEAWRGAVYGVVPATQSMRLAIAIQLVSSNLSNWT